VADRLWDGEAAQPTGRTEVLVREGRIAAIGPRVDAPGGTPTVDLGARTLLPGLIDCHVHVLDSSLATASVGRQTLQALPPLRDLLGNGFTTVRDLGCADQPVTIDLRQALADGTITGPRLVVAPNLISARGGHGDKEPGLTARYGVEVGTLGDGSAEVVRRVREQARQGADWIKFVASGGYGSENDDPAQVSYTQSEMDALVAAATDLGLPCAVHAYNDESIRRAIRAGVRSVEHANLASPETLALAAERGTYVVPAQYAQFYYVDRLDDDDFWQDKPPYLRSKYQRHAGTARVSARHLADSDVTIAFGTDASMFPHAQNWREFPTMVSHGITPLRALRAATSVAADLLRRPDLGRIRPGAVADLIALAGDPFDDITATGRVEFIMQNGHIHRGPRGVR
jgi:tryptophan 2-monooxygenase